MAPIHPVSEISSAPAAPADVYYNTKGIPPPATYRQRRRSRSPCCCCLLWMCSILTFLVVILGIAVLVFWLVVHPKAPKYDVQNVQISGLSLSDGATVNPKTTFELEANNRNKHIGIYYDEIHVMVEANGGTIGDGYLPAFYQGHQNITYIYGDIGYNGASLNQATIDNLSSGQLVPLNVNVDVKARLKIGSWKSRKVTVKVRCDMDLDLANSAGEQSVSNQHCSAKLKM